MRDTGIDIIGKVPWGTHFCQFYQDERDLIDILVPYFKAGLEQNEFCMWVTSEPLRVEQAKAALGKAVGNLDDYIRAGQIEFLDYREWYTLGGHFESERVLQGWVDKLDGALERGYEGLRLTGNTFWLENANWQDFTAYEAAVDSVLGQYRMLAMCTYSLVKCGAPEIMDVVSNHEFALIKRGGDWQIIESAERKKLETSLKESEERYRSLFNGMTEGFALHEIICDGDGKPVDYRFLEINPAFERLTGLKKDDMVGRTVNEALPGTEHYWIEKYGNVALTGESVHFENYSSALQRYFEVFAYRPAPRQFAVLFIDITERKQLEIELARERAFLETAIDVLPLPLAFFDPREKIIRENHASQVLRRQLGVTGQAKADFLDPQTKTPIPEDRQPTLRALRGEIMTAEEYLLQSPADDYRMPALVSAAPICIEGETVAAVSLIEDISALKEADRAKDEFLAVLSHELQSPLVSMLGWSREALDDGGAEFMAQAMEVVQRNAVRQKRLIDEILDMSRLIHRKIHLNTRPAELWEQACQAVENIRYEAENRQIALVLAPPDATLPIDADPERLQQCIGNLLHNSLKFTPAGGTITVSCRGEGEQGMLSIRDTGRGIAPEALPELFVVFRQVDRDERAGGLGLGLAVSRGIIELHGGRISAASPGLGLGSTFTIALPLACVVSA